MKRCIVTDLHGVSPSVLMKRLEGQVEGWAFLGDYDDPRVLKEIIALKQDRIITIGNHDYFYAIPPRPGVRIGDDNMVALFDLWKQHGDETEFVLDALDYWDGSTFGIRVARTDKIGKVIYVHSVMSSSSQKSINDRLYYELEPEKAKAENFQEMVESDVRLMFRGHDHLSKILSSDMNGKEMREEEPKFFLPFNFEKNRRYVVSVAGFFDDGYAIYDNEASSVVLAPARKELEG